MEHNTGQIFKSLSRFEPLTSLSKTAVQPLRYRVLCEDHLVIKRRVVVGGAPEHDAAERVAYEVQLFLPCLAQDVLEDGGDIVPYHFVQTAQQSTTINNLLTKKIRLQH